MSVPEINVAERIVVGVDGSPGARAALEWALREAHRTRREVEVVHAWSLTPAPYIDADLVMQSARDWHRQVLDETVAAAMSAAIVDDGAEPVVVRRRLVEGHPYRVLTEASEGAAMLVVGSRGRREIAGMLLGSVGLHTVTHARCPVVVVPQPTAQEPPKPTDDDNVRGRYVPLIVA